MVCVFARRPTEPLASLVKQIDQKIGEHGELKGFVVYLPTDPARAAGELEKLAKSAGIQNVPLTIGERPDGPPDYEIARAADMTVLMWTRGAVRVNRAFKGDPTPNQIRDVLAEIPKVLND